MHPPSPHLPPSHLSRHSGGEEAGQVASRLLVLEEELQSLRAALDALPDMVYIVDRATMLFVHANEQACAIASYSLEEHLRIGPHDLLNIDRDELERQFDALIARPGESETIESMGRGKDGGKAYVEVHHRAVRVAGRWLIVSASRNVSKRKLAEQAAQSTSRMYALLSATNEAILHAQSPEQLFNWVCTAAIAHGGYSGAAILLPEIDGTVRHAAAQGLASAPRNSLMDTSDGPGKIVAAALQTLQPRIERHPLANHHSPHQQEPRTGAFAGAAFPLLREGRAAGALLLHSVKRRDFDDEVVKLLERMAENVAFALENMARAEESRANQARILHLASHDSLTGLPNRSAFAQLLNRTISTAARHKRGFGLLFVDLDGFKLINDNHGHAAGDKLLREVSVRLTACMREDDVVARLGGDEMVALVHEMGSPDAVAAVARRILAAIMRPVDLGSHICHVTASVGISLYPVDATDEQGLLKCADLAMYQAKRQGKNSFRFFVASPRATALL